MNRSNELILHPSSSDLVQGNIWIQRPVGSHAGTLNSVSLSLYLIGRTRSFFTLPPWTTRALASINSTETTHTSLRSLFQHRTVLSTLHVYLVIRLNNNTHVLSMKPISLVFRKRKGPVLCTYTQPPYVLFHYLLSSYHLSYQSSIYLILPPKECTSRPTPHKCFCSFACLTYLSAGSAKDPGKRIVFHKNKRG